MTETRKEALRKVSFLSGSVAQDVGRWWGQCCPNTQFDPDMMLPLPENLAALADFCSALVLTDGVVTTYGDLHMRQWLVPEWAHAGATNLYNFIEWFLLHLTADTEMPELEPWRNLYQATMREVESRRGVQGQDVPRKLYMKNYLAWEACTLSGYAHCLLAGEPAQDYSSAVPICDADYVVCRHFVEDTRPVLKDIIGRPFASVAVDMGEVQLPIVLATAISPIDKPEQLPEELHRLRRDMTRIRSSMGKLEETVSSGTCPKSGRQIRLLRSNLEDAVRRASGSSVGTPSNLQQVAGLLSQDPVSATGSFLSSFLPASIYRYLCHPELRLLSRWTKRCAYDTVGRLRKVFKTKGTDREWRFAAEGLQMAGTLAWYPMRRSTS